MKAVPAVDTQSRLDRMEKDQWKVQTKRIRNNWKPLPTFVDRDASLFLLYSYMTSDT